MDNLFTFLVPKCTTGLDFIRLTEAFVAAFKIIISKAIKRIEKIRRFI